MVKIKNIKDLLSEAPFFEGFAEPYLDLISGCGEIVHFKPNAFLLKEGEEANSFYLIRKGEVAIESHMPAGAPLVISKVGPEGVVGYSWLFPPHRNQFDSRAVTDVEAVRLDGTCLRGKAEEDHELGYQFMKRFAQIMIQRMQAARRQALDIYGGSNGKAA
ncbi:MAG: Crp/Fnr family transcriptional regulator [Alphaproteobacteria bacterium]|nr:Crp/Fnr family transcriptional regulator [Alphaproteobacteria bacterium]